MLWFSSDHHFGHRNIVNYCNRPFRSDGEPDTAAMNDALVTRHNDLVAPEDEVWFLGDVVLGNLASGLAAASACHGTKTLVVGNHDRMFDRRGGGSGRQQHHHAYTAAGFGRIIAGQTRVALPGGPHVTACHFPYDGDSRDTDRFAAHRPVDDGQTWLLHGHVHDRWRQRGRQINVGVDAWGGRPVSAAQVAALIAAGPANLPPLPW